MNSQKKNNILKRIRLALTESTPIPFNDLNDQDSIFQTPADDAVVEFAERFNELQGRFCFCETHNELISLLKQLISDKQWNKVYCSIDFISKELDANLITSEINDCAIAITACEKLVARTGSIILTSKIGRAASVYSPIHICIAYVSQIVYDNKQVLETFSSSAQNLPSSISFASGPSRTADIEKTLVVGVHGPKEVYCFLVDELVQAS